MKNQKTYVAGSFVLAMLCLPGCDWLKSDKAAEGSQKVKQESVDHSVKDTSEVLMSVNGRSVMTVKEYEEQLDMARKANQQVDMILQMMPNAEKEYIFKGMAAGKMMEEWGKKQGINKRPEFLAQRKQLHEAMDLQLYMKYYDEAHPVHISDSDLKKFYEEKKDTIPQLVVSPGGVSIQHARFDDKKKAEEFFEKVKDVKSASAFDSAAKEMKDIKVSEAVVNQASQFGEALKTTILSLKTFPAVRLVKVTENTYWVVFAKEKAESQYRKFDDPEVKQGLRKMMTDELKSQQIETQMEALKKEMNVVENHAYFDAKAAKKQAAMSSDQQQMQMAQQAAQGAQAGKSAAPKAPRAQKAPVAKV